MDSVCQGGQYPPDTTLQEQSGLGGPPCQIPSTGYHPTRAKWTRCTSVVNTHRTPIPNTRQLSNYTTRIKKQSGTYKENILLPSKTLQAHIKRISRRSSPGIQNLSRQLRQNLTTNHANTRRMSKTLKNISRKCPPHIQNQSRTERETIKNISTPISKTSRPGGWPWPHMLGNG